MENLQVKTATNNAFKRTALATLVLALGLPAAAKPLADFVTTQSVPGNWARTATYAHDTIGAGATHIGLMSASKMVSISVALKVRNKPQLDELTSKIMAHKASPITQAEFLNQFAPTEAQAQAVVDHLTRNGFINVKVAPNRLLITADGQAGAIKHAFNAELHEFDVHGRRAFANVTPAQVPASLGNIVLAVNGLQNVNELHTMLKKASPGTNASTQGIVAVSPTLFSSIYGGSSLPAATNATIGIITAGDMSQTITDLKSFAANSGYPTPSVSTTYATTAGTSTSGTDEWNMDSQASLATAGGTIKSMILYAANSMSNSDITAAINKAVTDNKAKVINVSLGECETGAQSSGMTASTDQILQNAVAQGQTFSASSGDSGSYECGGSTSYQSYPAVSPYVMAIGGTTLSSSGGSWVGETVWSCSSSSTCAASASGGTGGGVSSTESAPSWQTASGVLGSSTKRGVPDIAFDAAPSSGALVLINGSNSTIGGTSLAAPIFAGFYARIQSANGNTLPFPAQTLYQGAAANPSWFHDVTSGSNGGYSAKTGWDYTTGFGSLQVANFATAFSGGTGGGSTATANFSSSVSGLTANFTDSSTDSGSTITAHAWTFGDGATSTATNPSHTYAASGTYTVTETVTDALGATGSKSASVTVSGGGTSSQLLLNPGFESGSTSWTATSGIITTSTTGEPSHGGSYLAYLDGYGSSHTDTLSQTVTIPAGKTSATLTFWLHIDTAETTSSSAYDKLTLTAKSGTSTSTLATYSNLNKGTGYKQYSINMNSYIGKTVTITFTGKEDSSLQTSFTLDDMALTVQ
jgi:xanthomonalisin